MSDGGWMPVHHEQVEESDEPTPQPPGTAAPKPHPTPKPKDPAANIPLTLVMSIPPELIAALSSLSGTMERIATEVAAQGRAIQMLAEAISKQTQTPPELDS